MTSCEGACASDQLKNTDDARKTNETAIISVLRWKFRIATDKFRTSAVVQVRLIIWAHSNVAYSRVSVNSISHNALYDFPIQFIQEKLP